MHPLAAAVVYTMLMTVAAHPAAGQLTAAKSGGLIDGAVTDSALVPIDGAVISVFQTTVRVETGTSGRFRIQQIPAGQYLIIVKRLGFRPVSGFVDVKSSDTVRLAYVLERAVTELAPVTTTEQHVSMRMLEFEYRRLQGEGQFLTGEQIDRHGAVYATELVRTFHGVNVIPRPGGGGNVQYVAISSRDGMGTTKGIGCETAIFVDGMRQMGMVNLDNLPSPKEIAGIEMYPGPATAPLQYGGSGTRCGVILIWTKSGG